MEAANAIIGVTTGIFPLIDRIEKFSNKYMAKRHLASANVELHARLLEEYERAAQLIETIEKASNVEHSPICNEIIRGRLDMFKSNLDANNMKLDALWDEISMAGTRSRVGRANVILEKCRTDIMEFFVFVTDAVLPSLRENVSKDQEASRSNIPASDGAAIPPRPTKASHMRGSNTPRNPPQLALDYTTTDTSEGRLKAAILEGSRGGIRGVAAIGHGGVGKTCALRGLAEDMEIRQEFPGGILYISLGQFARVSDVINEIANAVEVTGGKQLAAEVRCARTVCEASTKASRWFRPHKCLFLVNDLWWRDGITSDIFGDLGNMLLDDSVLVYTTRDKRFLRDTDIIVLFVPINACGEVAQRMLMASAGFGEEIERPIEREAFRGILQLCNGLPLAIAVAGATVRRYIGNRAVSEQDAWGDYYRKLKSKEEDTVSEIAAELRLIVDNSLEILESKEIKYMFRTFCVFRNQQEIGGHVLQKLWNLPELCDALEMAEMFESLSLVRVNKTGNKFSVQVHDHVLDIARRKASELHEVKKWFKTLLDNYIRPEPTTLAPEVTATEDTESQEKGVRMVLSAAFASAGKSLCCQRCVFCFTGGAKKDTPKRREASMFRQWWNIEDDGFILDDLCRVLHGAEETEELLWLLKRAQWILMRLQKSGIHGVKQDLVFGMQAADKSTVGTLSRTEVVNYMKLLGSAARMSCVHVANNEYEAWYQMYGRLVVHEEACRLTHRFVSEIEEHAPRPWIRPSVGFLEGAGGMCLETIRIERSFRVLYVSHSENMMRILWLDRDYIVCITEYDKRYGRERVHRLVPNHLSSESSCGNWTGISDAWVRSSKKCMCGAFFNEDRKMVTGHHDGNIFVWDVGSEYIAEKVLRSTGIVRCVGTSGNGTRIVSGSREGTLRVWDTCTGALDSSAIDVCRGVKCISTSSDGKRVLICLENGDVQTWTEAGEGMILPSEIPNAYVCCVAISEDGSLAVCGTLEGKLWLWNVDSPEDSARTLTGHTRDVMCVALSGDGRRLVSGSSDKTVRVWDTKSGVIIGKPFEGHTFRVLHVAMDADGKEIVSISSDATIRVWNVGQMAASDTPERFDNRVRCIAYCGHGNRIVSGSDDGYVRMWDVRSGRIIGNDLHSHKYTVEYVAVSGSGNVVASLSVEDGTVFVHDLRGRGFPSCGKLSISATDYIALDYEGTLVAIGSEKGLYVLDTRTGRKLWSCTGLKSRLTCIAMSKKGTEKKGTIIACGLTSRDILVWNLSKAGLESGRTLAGHGEEVRSLACSRDGKRVVSGSADCTVRVWDVATGETVGDSFDHDSQVFHVESDSECLRVVSYDETGHGRLWDVAQKRCMMTSSEPSWKKTLRGHGIAGFRWLPRGREIMKITSRSDDGNEQLLASSERAVIRVGDFYFSNVQSSAFWPFCRVES